MKRTLIAAIALLALTTAAMAQSQTYYGADGKMSGRSTTDSSGSTTYYGADGRVTARSSTSGNVTTFYDAGGRSVGSARTLPLMVPRRP